MSLIRRVMTPASQRIDQAVQHSADLLRFSIELGPHGRRQVAQVASEKELAFDLPDRAASDAEKAGQVWISSPATSLRDVRNDGERRAPDLGSQPKLLASWKRLGIR